MSLQPIFPLKTFNFILFSFNYQLSTTIKIPPLLQIKKTLVDLHKRFLEVDIRHNYCYLKKIYYSNCQVIMFFIMHIYRYWAAPY